MFDTVLPQYVNNTIYQMLLEVPRLRALQPDGRHEERHRQRQADASRTSRLEYNKLRQAAITNELLEITTAKMALE